MTRYYITYVIMVPAPDYPYPHVEELVIDFEGFPSREVLIGYAEEFISDLKRPTRYYGDLPLKVHDISCMIVSTTPTQVFE